MKNLKVSKKLFVSFGIVLLLMTAANIMGTTSLNAVSAKLKGFYKGQFTNVQIADDLDGRLNEVAKNMLLACLSKDSSETEKRLNQVEEIFTKLNSNVSSLNQNYRGDHNDIAKISQALSNIQGRFADFRQRSDVERACGKV